MLLTNHALTGALIGLSAGDPVVTAPLAFTSHFVLDSTPHFGGFFSSFKSRKAKIVGTVDVLVAFSVYIFLLMHFPSHWLVITSGVFFACLPDLLYLPEIFFGWIPAKRLLAFHHRIQWSETPLGTLTDIAWGSLMISLLSKFQ